MKIDHSKENDGNMNDEVLLDMLGNTKNKKHIFPGGPTYNVNGNTIALFVICLTSESITNNT